MSFLKEIVLPVQLEAAIQKMGFTTPTPIQSQAIPIFLNKRDLIAIAQTGTGKTAAFGIPLLTLLMKAPQKNALILVPTRELAVQVTDTLKKLCIQLPQFKTATLIGGMPMIPQKRDLMKKPRIVVATPGRLVDHLRRGNLSLRSSEYLILDEADRMLDMGFLPQIQEVLRFLPSVRHTFLFSATMSSTIDSLASKYLNSPERIKVGPVSKPVEKINQKSLLVHQSEKKKALRDNLSKLAGTAIVFTRTKHRADHVFKDLQAAGYKAERIHSGRTQGQRLRVMNDFRSGQVKILVATDIVARGLDVSHVSQVVNFDLPVCPEDYIHRIGRTARAGLSGEALSFVTPEEKGLWRKISGRYNSKQ